MVRRKKENESDRSLPRGFGFKYLTHPSGWVRDMQDPTAGTFFSNLYFALYWIWLVTFERNSLGDRTGENGIST